MRDEDALREYLRSPPKRAEPLPETGYCDLCGKWDTHLIEGCCPSCRSKYKLVLSGNE